MKLKYLLLMGAVYMGSSLQAQQKITEETSFSMPFHCWASIISKW